MSKNEIYNKLRNKRNEMIPPKLEFGCEVLITNVDLYYEIICTYRANIGQPVLVVKRRVRHLIICMGT